VSSIFKTSSFYADLTSYSGYILTPEVEKNSLFKFFFWAYSLLMSQQLFKKAAKTQKLILLLVKDYG